MNYPTPRSTISEMVRYQPNLSVNKSQRVIRLSANEGAFGPSPKAKAVLTNIGENMHWYPQEEPLALAEAFRQGNLGVMDFYRMQNIMADTTMRESIANDNDNDNEE